MSEQGTVDAAVSNSNRIATVEKGLKDLNDQLKTQLFDMQASIETTNQHLQDATYQFKYMRDEYEDMFQEYRRLVAMVAWLRKRLAVLLPEPNNCTKCGAKLVRASRKCACGHQN